MINIPRSALHKAPYIWKFIFPHQFPPIHFSINCHILDFISKVATFLLDIQAKIKFSVSFFLHIFRFSNACHWLGFNQVYLTIVVLPSHIWTNILCFVSCIQENSTQNLLMELAWKKTSTFLLQILSTLFD